MREIWKKIVYDGETYEDYQVSNLGRVKSLKFGKEKILRLIESTGGYLIVNLCKNGKMKRFKVHRLVASTFIENPENKPQINHKDEVKTNNFVGTPENDYKDGNLEWCSNEYNHNYGTHNDRVSKANTNGKRSKPVLQFTLDGDFVREWPSISECERNGFYTTAVCKCCNGKRKTHKGFIWKYKKEVV